MNATRTFIDTNILIYAFSTDEPTKQKIALEILDNCLPVISTQVVKEFSNVLLRKKKVSLQNLEEIIAGIMEVADVVNEEVEFILTAFDIHKRYQFSFYDSLVVATALASNCKILLSEDMNDGQVIEDTLKIVNPFK